MRGSRTFYQSGPALTVFFVDVGRYNQNTTKTGHHRPARETPFRWRADDCPTLNAGLVAALIFMRSGPVLLGNPIFVCVLFQGVGGGPGPPLDPHL